MGPAVNKAARLESMCSRLQSNYVVSSEAFVEGANFTFQGLRALKGIKKRQQVYRLSPMELA